ncbi:MAG: hypothetical protein CMG35_05075 [Candidatus Marinimicrobia bacterium]|nr:hypothetical protein [Candidatus Neomarinimicrobiota bacterium]
MAIGRISGPLLKANLLRNGVNLAFETNLLYLDVNNSRVGINNANPQYDLDVGGTTRAPTINVSGASSIGTVQFNGNTISSTSPTLVLGTADNVVYNKRLTIDSIDIRDNIISTNESNANIEFVPNGVGTVEIIGDTNVQGNITATGNITANGNITIGDADTDNVTFNADIASNIIPDATNTYNIGSSTKKWNNAYVNDVQSNQANIGDVNIAGSVIQTSVSNADLELRANGTGSVVIDDLTFKDSTVSSTTDLTFAPGSGNINITGTGSFKIPSGTTAQRPTPAVGKIRYNTDNNNFEGYNGSNWIILNGVQDLDGNTNITAELTPGANDNTIRFNVSGSTVVDINSTRLNAPKVVVDDITIDGSTVSTSATNTDLNLDANGTGSVVFDGTLAIKDNTITNLTNGGVTEFLQTGTGYVKFGGTGGFVLPVGTSGQRPGAPEIGMVRYNTAESRVEVYDGSWSSVAGAGAGISLGDAENIALELVISLG